MAAGRHLQRARRTGAWMSHARHLPMTQPGQKPAGSGVVLTNSVGAAVGGTDGLPDVHQFQIKVQAPSSSP